MIYDFAVTENWVSVALSGLLLARCQLLIKGLCVRFFSPVIPQFCDLERLKQGGEHWQWSPETPFYIGVIPRYGAKSSDVKVRGFL